MFVALLRERVTMPIGPVAALRLLPLGTSTRRRHDWAHEQLVDPALGLDGGGEFLERDLVEAASRGCMALGQIIEAELDCRIA